MAFRAAVSLNDDTSEPPLRTWIHRVRSGGDSLEVRPKDSRLARPRPDVRAFGDAGMSRRWLHAGATLLSKGDATPAHFFVVISGRVRVASSASDSDDADDAVEDISRGGVIGLCAVLTGQDVLDFDALCVRDTELVRQSAPVTLSES